MLYLSFRHNFDINNWLEICWFSHVKIPSWHVCLFNKFMLHCTLYNFKVKLVIYFERTCANLENKWIYLKRNYFKMLTSNNFVFRWRKGEITNFEYLTELNKTAGRSFNDLMQYPVFPFVLRDFQSDVLDLNNDSSFR